jgi:hypothetical protein
MSRGGPASLANFQSLRYPTLTVALYNVYSVVSRQPFRLPSALRIDETILKRETQ